jgi:glucose-6-phosphate 1-dehydrogenase
MAQTTAAASTSSPNLATPDPTIFVLFGATGDLAKRMVIPAFYELAQQKLLPKSYRLIGNGRGDVSHEDFRSRVRESLEQFGPPIDEAVWTEFSANLYFAGGGFEAADPGSLLDVLDKAREAMGGHPQHIHYLAVPPLAFAGLTEGLGAHGLAAGSRVVYEKPFGTSPSAFRELDEAVHRVLDESQVYRIDHFLGKEATQDLHVLRFANGLLSGIWNREHVRGIQIDVPEDLDIADRADFYDHTGAVLDMLVTHLFQVAAEIAMEPPASLEADDLQAARETVIASFRPLDVNDVVLGQFEGYRDEAGIAKDSSTDTFVAAKLWVDTDRWRDVPFLMRTGKRLAKTAQVVTLLLRDPDDGPLAGTFPEHGNSLSFSLAGSGELDLSLVVKKPGAGLELTTATSSIPLSSVNGGNPLPPYVRLIHDVLMGDRSLFTRPDGLAKVWEVVTPLLEHPPTPLPYAPGSWGPAAADELAAPDGWLLGG